MPAHRPHFGQPVPALPLPSTTLPVGPPPRQSSAPAWDPAFAPTLLAGGAPAPLPPSPPVGAPHAAAPHAAAPHAAVPLAAPHAATPHVAGPLAAPHVAAPAVPRASSIPPAPFSLEPGRDDDVALVLDARTGFSHLLPGRPSLAVARAGDPPADATVHLQDAPITLRYKLEHPSVQASSAGELARLTAERFACWRAQAPVAVEFANPSWLLSWGSEAAAVATYDVALGSNLPMREDLFVLVRQGLVYVVTWTYPRGFTDDPAYATFASVAEATMVWDPARWEQRGRVWPESPFVGAGIYAQPKPRYAEAARWLSGSTLPDDERAHVLGVLSGVVSGAGAPWVELRPDVLERSRSLVLAAFRGPELQTFVRGALAEVRTAHDLRGLAVLLGRALDARRASRPGPR